MADGVPPLPVGWPLLPRPDGAGSIAFPTLGDSVQQSIRVILRTRPGEQLMRPTFGAGLQDFLDQSGDLATRRRLREAITSSLELWEPRIVLDRVDLVDDPLTPTKLHVEIAYRIRRTGAAQRLGVSMDVGS
jgi:phage baseplate assembly protein W